MMGQWAQVSVQAYMDATAVTGCMSSSKFDDVCNGN